MKIVVNPDYDNFHDYMMRLPEAQNHDVKKTFCNHRNTVDLRTVNGIDIVVKRYKRPTLFNCVVYTFFRKNKGQNAYENSLRLKELGVNVPDPIGYLVQKKYGFVHTVYFVCRYIPMTSVREHFSDGERIGSLEKDLFHYYLHLGDLGVEHRDFNLSNILAEYNAGKYEFALIDINRMTFHNRNHQMVCDVNNAVSMRLDRGILDKFFDAYSQERGTPKSAIRLAYGLREGLHILNRDIQRFFKKPFKKKRRTCVRLAPE